mmetsp:Transcript_14154/g.25590  ORF Transcript_14154/g.25590 Transcript_14154/m.25590 type:complete len:227 (-) Transcript_14154:9-689(-)
MCHNFRNGIVIYTASAEIPVYFSDAVVDMVNYKCPIQRVSNPDCAVITCPPCVHRLFNIHNIQQIGPVGQKISTKCFGVGIPCRTDQHIENRVHCNLLEKRQWDSETSPLISKGILVYARHIHTLHGLVLGNGAAIVAGNWSWRVVFDTSVDFVATRLCVGKCLLPKIVIDKLASNMLFWWYGVRFGKAAAALMDGRPFLCSVNDLVRIGFSCCRNQAEDCSYYFD